MLTSLLDLHKRENLQYKQIADGYGVTGDCVYDSDSSGWWDYAYTGFFKGEIPKTLEDIIKRIDKRYPVEEWIRKYKINVFVCKTRACYGAMPIISLYNSSGMPFSDKNILTDRENIAHSFHMFWVDLNEKDILSSRVFCCNGEYCYCDDLIDSGKYGEDSSEDSDDTIRAQWPDGRDVLTYNDMAKLMTKDECIIS